MSERFLYEVHPIRPFISPDGKEIKKACSVQLTKDEVKEFMKKCTVYRKFSGLNYKMERVTLSNLDSLHAKAKGDNEVVTEAPSLPALKEIKAELESASVEAPLPPITASKVEVELTALPETSKEEKTTTEDNTPEEVVEEDHTEEAVTEDSVEEAEEDTTDEEVTSESVDDILKEGTVPSSNGNQYHGKNKKKHH